MAAALTGDFVAASAAEPNYALKRVQMIRTIEAQVRDTSYAIGRDRIDPRILDVMGALPRHEFVPEDLREDSYKDRPLPIGYGQTISQPLIVALMTDILNVDPTSMVLEVGTGSGYQAAVVAALVRQVYTIEIIPDLARNAADQTSSARAHERYVTRWGRLFRMVGRGSLRRNHRHCSRRSHSAPVTATIEARRSDGNTGRPAIWTTAPHGRRAWC